MKSEEQEYLRTIFPAEVIKQATAVFDAQINPNGKLKLGLYMSAVVGGGKAWTR